MVCRCHAIWQKTLKWEIRIFLHTKSLFGTMVTGIWSWLADTGTYLMPTGEIICTLSRLFRRFQSAAFSSVLVHRRCIVRVCDSSPIKQLMYLSHMHLLHKCNGNTDCWTWFLGKSVSYQDCILILICSSQKCCGLEWLVANLTSAWLRWFFQGHGRRATGSCSSHDFRASCDQFRSKSRVPERSGPLHWFWTHKWIFVHGGRLA